MGNAGLLIIDVQKGSFRSGIPIHNERELLENTNILLDRAHASGVPVFLVQYADDSSWAEGTENWQLHPGLHRSQGDTPVCKRTSSALDDTSIQEHLRNLGITRLVAAGIASQWCVRSTCLHAKELGFEVTLAKDAHGTATPNAALVIEKVHSELLARGIDLKPTDEIAL